MLDKVFVYLRLRVGDTFVARSKIREFAALGSLLPSFLRQAAVEGSRLAAQLAAPGAPALDYVDANTEDVLISFRLDPVRRLQVVEGQIPRSHQGRMLDPKVSGAAVDHFLVAAERELDGEDHADVTRRLERQPDLLALIRETMDAEGRFVVHLPIS